MASRYRRWVHKLLAGTHRGFGLSRAVNVTIIGLILASVLAFILESFDWIGVRYNRYFRIFEAVSVILFTIEYVGRLWTAPEHDEYEGEVSGRLRWAITPLAVVDLLAILPFYLRGVLTVDLRVLRLLRVLRIVRVLKLARYSQALRAIVEVIQRKKAQLVMTLAGAGLMFVLAASLMWIAEGSVQPDVFPNVPATMWWAIVTLTTVGYGDVVPVTAFGKVVAGLLALVGVSFIALPASILASGFVEKFREPPEGEMLTAKEKAEESPPEDPRCPRCGRPLDSPED